MTEEDLARIGEAAAARLALVFERAPVAGLYRDRLLLLALCQGSALHYVDRKNGVKDVDVWAFFKGGLDRSFPFRTVWTTDLGPSPLGRHPDDKGYAGRRIDVIGRPIIHDAGDDPAESVRRWLKSGGSSPSEIAKRPVIGLAPSDYFGQVLWNPFSP